MKDLLLAVLLVSLSAAQTSSPPPPPGRQPAPAAANAATAGAVDLNQLLAGIQTTATAINGSIGHLRIEKWKTDSQSKGQYQSNAESIQRNLSEALPGMMDGVRTAPDNLSASFKLYRNLDALYDVFASLTEATGAFGPKDDYQPLAEELQQVNRLRHVLADRIDQLAAARDADLARLRAQVQQAQATPPKKKKRPVGAAAQSSSPQQ